MDEDRKENTSAGRTRAPKRSYRNWQQGQFHDFGPRWSKLKLSFLSRTSKITNQAKVWKDYRELYRDFGAGATPIPGLATGSSAHRPSASAPLLRPPLDPVRPCTSVAGQPHQVRTGEPEEGTKGMAPELLPQDLVVIARSCTVYQYMYVLCIYIYIYI